jgi:tetratricopeptide (TPR) repeat protein
VLVWGVLFYLLQIVLVLQFVTIGSAIVAERYTYLSYLGLFFIMGYFLQKIYDQHANKRAFVYTIIAAFALLCVVLSTKQISTWQSGETLWTQVIKQHPHRAEAYNYRGLYYNEEQKTEKALADFNKALDIKPNYVTVLNYRGTFYFGDNQLEKALADYEKIIFLNPKDKKELAKAYIGKASCMFKDQKYDAVITDCSKALELDSTYARAYLNRGASYLVTSQYEKAISDLTKYINSDDLTQHLNSIKDNSQAYYWRGLSFNQTAKYQEALQDFNAVIALKPDNGEYYYYRSLSHEGLGNATQAQADVQKAIQLGYKIPN